MLRSRCRYRRCSGPDAGRAEVAQDAAEGRGGAAGPAAGGGVAGAAPARGLPRREHVRRADGSARPLLRRARAAPPLHPRLRQLGLREGGEGVEHLREAAVAVLRGDGEGRGAGPLLPPLQRLRPQARPPALLPHRPQQPAQPDLLAVRQLRPVPPQRHPHPLPGQEVRGDLRQPAVLLAAPGVHGHPQVHGLRQDLGALPVLLHAVPQDVQQAQPRRHHQAERAGGGLHRLAHRRAAPLRRPHRLQHPGRSPHGPRLRQLARAAGLGDGHRHQGDLQPPPHLRRRERGRLRAGPRLLLLRRLRPAGRRAVQVQRPRVALRAGPRRQLGVRLQAQHGRPRVRPLQALPLRPALAESDRPGGQRMRG
ncbi:hypothetical protein llap_12526 [Limosa lapponica baueri]|uniref:Uncharacterized protein n=1 Tax=Limosa lapponica baueri TaxID=1758121 RepID=A0A2I0TTQ2_LIMLA|nr:hypothetical protein llap_12526 [Limosa lapponica baueri]